MTIRCMLLVLFYALLAHGGFAQTLSQTVRGSITEKVLQKPVGGAVIVLAGTSIGAVADSDGHFFIADVPVGTHTFLVTALGFREQVVANIVVNSGKEVVLSITLEEKLLQGKEVVVKAGRRTLNEMSMVSARSFTVEETQKYAAAVNDPARMAANFAGVMAGDDGNNLIVIRGNSPSGLLWRMEGIDVPNPNHFASSGSSGGGISILSTQLLSNSDFVTGAFAAEYGNALSGVFDLRLRKGNNEKREYTAQAGILGLNLAAEGPFAKNYKGSYLINYRYSTLSILSKIGFSFTPSTTNFQDLSYNIFLPTKRFGQFSLFSFGGLSNQFYHVVKDSTQWKNEAEKYGDEFVSNTGLWGATHQVRTSKNMLVKTALAYSLSNSAYNRNYVQENYTMLNVYDQQNIVRRLTLSCNVSQRFNAGLMLRSGLVASHIQLNYHEQMREKTSLPLKELVNVSSSTQTLQAFSQLQYKLTDKLTFNAGLHYIHLLLNHRQSLEPRASVKWDLHPRQTLSFGYGHHSQLQGWGVYFTTVIDTAGTKTMPNRDLDFSKAHHFVLSHQLMISKNLKLKTELYYQHLVQIPVSISHTNTFSAVNMQADYIREALVNKGKGKNYGIEFSLDRQLNKNFYAMLSLSLYQSKYTAANGKQYNTRYNGQSIANITAGKDFVSKNGRRTLGLNIKSVYAGGYRTTPINLEQSSLTATAVYYQDSAFTKQLPAYFRTDIRISMKWNRKRLTSTLSLDIQNVSNRLNVYDRYYDTESKSVKTWYQQGLLPILNYKVEF